ncbi:MAG: hypothetical protein J1E38_04430 [Paramuribaculum sp.]|nr:hypothetical protein [Paramuribaculum sp.]
MRKSLIYTAVSAVVALSSCSTVKNTAYTTTPEAMIINMTVADIDVAQQQVSATVTWHWNPFRTITSRKKNAEAVALRESKADVLIEPTYEVVKRGLFRGGSITVTGHPGKFINFRNMTEKDVEIINTLSNKVGVGTPAIATTGPSFLERFKRPKEPKAPKIPQTLSDMKRSKSFLSLVASTIKIGDYDEKGQSLGLMYGHYGSKWGWYAKGVGAWGENDCSGGFSLTGGVIKTLPYNFNLFAGTGLGMTIYNGEFGIPLELGLQWNWKKLNILAGYQVNLCPADTGENDYSLFCGVGFNF